MASSYRIGDLIYDAGQQSLRRGTDVIPLGPLTQRLLQALIDAAPNVVDHDELARVVWDGRPVTPETVSQRVKLLRDALGDHAQSPRYVEVVRSRGYRLIPEVVPQGVPQGIERRGTRRRARWAVAAVTLALAMTAVVWSLGAFRAPVDSRQSVAVLPFVDLSPDQSHGYLADGLADELLNVLSSSSSLRVIARTSSFRFRNHQEDIATIAEQLGVSHVVEGSVRKSGDRVRVAAKLVSAHDGAQVWLASYDRDIVDVLQLQIEIAHAVAGALEASLLGPAAGQPPPRQVDPEAYDLYLRGLQALRDFRLGDAESYFDQSIAIDPGFMPAHQGLGEAYVRHVLDVGVSITEYRPKLRDLLDRGFRHAPDDPGLVGLSGQLARYEGNFELAEQRFREALKRDPSNRTVRMVYAMLKGDQGYPEEAIRIIRPAQETDPLNPTNYIHYWSAAMDTGNPTDAILAIERYEKLATANVGVAARALRGATKVALLGDLVGGNRDWASLMDVDRDGVTLTYGDPLTYYVLEDFENGDAARAHYEPLIDSYPGYAFIAAYRHLAIGEAEQARELAVPLFVGHGDHSAYYEFALIARLATGALIDRGEAERALGTIDALAPRYKVFRERARIAPDKLAPAPYSLKSVYSSYPALLFPDYVLALRAAGDAVGGENMLNHLDAVLEWRRARGLLVESRHVAEARALRGDHDGALDALERGLRDRTIFHGWHAFLLHSPVFADLRQNPRFIALVGQIREDLAQQRAQALRERGQ